MAIQDSFNLNQAKNSQAYAYKCWYNYNYGGNTMKISSKDYGEITQSWKGELTNWRATASKDENAYEIPDDDFSAAKRKGKDQAKSKAGASGKTGGQITRGVVDGLSGLAGAAANTIGKSVASNLANTVVNAVASKAVKKTTEKIAQKAAEKVAEKVAKKTVSKAAAKAVTKAATEAATKAATEVSKKAAEAGVAGFVGKAAEKAAAKAAAKAAEKAGAEAAQKAGEEAGTKVIDSGKKVGWIITAPLSLATGIAYQAKKPNKTEKEACDELQNEMTNAQVALGDAQNEMSDMGDEIVALSDEAQMANEEANDGIEDKKTEFDMYKASYDALKAKLESGEPLSEDEKNLMKELVTLMQQLGVNITNIQDDTTKNVEEIYDNMSSYQEGYDNAAETMAEVEGLTDYAESFDEATRTMCYVEAASQALNATSGGKAAYDAGHFAASGGWVTAWAWAFSAAGASGAAMSGLGAIQQGQWAGEVGTEIHMRRDTQDLNSTTTEMYDENIDVYAGQMEGVEELELEIPEDMEVPEETETPTQQVPQDTTQTTSPQNSTTDDKDKDKKVK